MIVDTNLIICIGNTARGDDGAAHRVADSLRRRGLPPGTRVITATSLDVTMVEDVARCAFLVVVDAVRRKTPAVAVDVVEPGPVSRPPGHTMDAQALLAFAASLYGRAPRANLVTIAAPQMGHTEHLSETAEAASEEAASMIVAMLDASQTS